MDYRYLTLSSKQAYSRHGLSETAGSCCIGIGLRKAKLHIEWDKEERN